MSRWIPLMLGILISAGFTVISAGAADLAEGKKLFEAKCVQCHGPEGAGKAAIARLYKVEMKHLASPEIKAMSDAKIQEVILKGTGKMRAVKMAEGLFALRPRKPVEGSFRQPAAKTAIGLPDALSRLIEPGRTR